MKYSKKYINDYKFQFKITTIISIILIMISIYIEGGLYEKNI